MPRVRIQASQLVRYDQIVELSDDDYEQLLETAKGAEQAYSNEVDTASDLFLDPSDVFDADAIEMDSVTISVSKGRGIPFSTARRTQCRDPTPGLPK